MGKIVKASDYKGWLSVKIGVDLMHLESLIEHSEEYFNNKLKKFKKDIETATKKFSEEDKADYQEFYSDEYWKLSDIFPQIFRMSFLITCYSRLEFELVEICHGIQENHKMPKPNFNKPGKIYIAKDYLTDTAKLPEEVFNKSWDNIIHYNIIRNAFVHQNGLVAKEEDINNIEKYYSKNQGIISFQSKSPRIILKRGFCEKVLEDINNQLKSIFVALEQRGLKTTLQSVFN